MSGSQGSSTVDYCVGEENETEQVAAGRNEQGDQDTSVSDDVTTRLESGWTVVAGRTRTHGKVLPATRIGTELMPIADGPTSRMKTKRKDESRAHSFV
jgi:hypothetical protein